MNLRFPAAPSGGPRLTKPLLSFAVGLPVMKDNNGFISRVRPDGAVENLKVIEGGHGGETLKAPKGLAIRGETFWGAGNGMVPSIAAKTRRARGTGSRVRLRGGVPNDTERAH